MESRLRSVSARAACFWRVAFAGLVRLMEVATPILVVSIFATASMGWEPEGLRGGDMHGIGLDARNETSHSLATTILK